MAADSLEKSPTNKRVSRAVSYVSDYWFPVNEELLGKIKSGLRDGRYDNAVDELVYEIKSDLSLFTYSIGKLVQKLKEKGAELNGTLNPLSALRQAGIEQLREILEEASDDLSAHNLRQADDLQAARFKEVLISASSAEMLAEKFEVDGDTAFSAAVLRQLGYVLIAWNYPGQYREAVNSLEKGDNLDFKLAERLGFSPTLLAIRVLQSWGLTSVSCASVGLVDDLEEEEWEILEGIGENVTALCKIGETLARASAPEIYPDARGELQLAKREIKKHLGQEGIELIREHYARLAESYLTFVPHIFKAGLIIDLEEEFDDGEEGDPELRELNPYLVRCSPLVQLELKSLYSKIGRSKDPMENVKVFVHETVPACGFIAGYIYSLDPGVLTLLPQIKIGEPLFKDDRPVDYSLIGAGADIVSVAYQTVDPVREYRAAEEGNMFSVMAGYFGRSQRVGVIYLEAVQPDTHEGEKELNDHFKALSYALNDCLGL